VTSHATPSGATFGSTLPASLALSDLNAGGGVLANDCPPDTTGRGAPQGRPAAEEGRTPMPTPATATAPAAGTRSSCAGPSKAASRSSTSAPQITVVATLTGYDEGRPGAKRSPATTPPTSTTPTRGPREQAGSVGFAA
jgi:hypothetical protein